MTREERIKWLRGEIRAIDEWLPTAKDPNTGFWLTRRANLKEQLDHLIKKLDPDLEKAPPGENPGKPYAGTKKHFMEIISDTSALNRRLIELSKKHGGAWVFDIIPFSHETNFYQFASPSKVPDVFYDVTRGMGAYPKGRMAYKGKLQGFTEAAIGREQQKGWRRNPLDATEMRSAARDASGSLSIAGQHGAAGEHLEAHEYIQKTLVETDLLKKYSPGWDTPEEKKIHKRAREIEKRATAMLDDYHRKYKPVFFRRNPAEKFNAEKLYGEGFMYEEEMFRERFIVREEGIYHIKGDAATLVIKGTPITRRVATQDINKYLIGISGKTGGSMRNPVDQAAFYAENMYGGCANPLKPKPPLIDLFKKGKLRSPYTIKKSDIGRLMDEYFRQTAPSDVGRKIYFEEGRIRIGAKEKPKRKKNPLIPVEFHIAIDMVNSHINKARGLLETDPHAAEEEAYQAIGILKAVEEQGRALISISWEKKELLRKLYGICQQIIGRADTMQGRPIPNPQENPMHGEPVKVGESIYESFKMPDGDTIWKSEDGKLLVWFRRDGAIRYVSAQMSYHDRISLQSWNYHRFILKG